MIILQSNPAPLKLSHKWFLVNFCTVMVKYTVSTSSDSYILIELQYNRQHVDLKHYYS